MPLRQAVGEVHGRRRPGLAIVNVELRTEEVAARRGLAEGARRGAQVGALQGALGGAVAVDGESAAELRRAKSIDARSTGSGQVPTMLGWGGRKICPARSVGSRRPSGSQARGRARNVLRRAR